MKDFSRFQSEIIRQANTSSYSAGDMISHVSSSWNNQKFSNVSKMERTGICIPKISICTNDPGFAGAKLNVRLYNETPSTTFTTDNNPFTSSYSNLPKMIGVIPVVIGTGNNGLYGTNDYNISMANPPLREIYYSIETTQAITPQLTSSLFTTTIDVELSN